MSTTILSVFGKIREISARGIQPRPYISFGMLQQELGQSENNLAPLLMHLKKMRVIIFNNKAMSDIKLTMLGLQWDLMPR